MLQSGDECRRILRPAIIHPTDSLCPVYFVQDFMTGYYGLDNLVFLFWYIHILAVNMMVVGSIATQGEDTAPH